MARPARSGRRPTLLFALGGSVRTVLPRKSEPNLKTARNVLTARRASAVPVGKSRLGPGPRAAARLPPQPTKNTVAPTDKHD
jgi:hypothetical protein